MDLLALLGFVVLLAGLHLAWQARHTVLFWLRFLIRTWRAALRPAEPPPSPPSARPHDLHNLRLLGGFALIVLGQLLLALSLVF